jgi:hypothetical protein
MNIDPSSVGDTSVVDSIDAGDTGDPDSWEYVFCGYEIKAQVMEYKPELGYSVWVDYIAGDDDGNRLSQDKIVELLKDGVLKNEWTSWRLMFIHKEVIGVGEAKPKTEILFSQKQT